MKKDQLVRALVKAAKDKSTTKGKAKTANAKVAASSNAGSQEKVMNGKSSHGKGRNGKAANGKRSTAGNGAQPKSPVQKDLKVTRKIQKAIESQERQKDLTSPKRPRRKPRPLSEINKKNSIEKDRIVLMVRDSYWLHACWNMSRQSIDRVKAAMAELWHTAKPILRLYRIEADATTSAVEEVERDIEIHGGVTNWYIDVDAPPRDFRVALGYITSTGKFFALARSNSVTTPRPGSADDMDENWSAVMEEYERVYALSGGFQEDRATGDLQELFEERLRRPMGTPLLTQFGLGEEYMLDRKSDFNFDVDAEMIIFGATKPSAHVTLGGEPVRVRPDGSFTIRMNLPDKRQVLPIVASTSDGVEQRTIVLAVERNTKVMEPYVREPNG